VIDTYRYHPRVCRADLLPQVLGDESERTLGRIDVREDIPRVLLGQFDESLQATQVDDELHGSFFGRYSHERASFLRVDLDAVQNLAAARDQVTGEVAGCVGDQHWAPDG
jgi:hypothetical protein